MKVRAAAPLLVACLASTPSCGGSSISGGSTSGPELAFVFDNVRSTEQRISIGGTLATVSSGFSSAAQVHTR